MNMKSLELFLTATDKDIPNFGGTVEQPIWSDVEMRIQRAFQFGGTVQLSVIEPIYEHDGHFAVIESITMVSNPGKFRLIAAPLEKLGEKTKLREWWQVGDAPFRGTEKFGDDEWDTRTVCTDVFLAKQILKDFFDHRGLTKEIFEQTLSVWDRKAR